MTKLEQQSTVLPERLFSPAVFLVSLGWMCQLHLLDFENNSNIAPAYQRVIVLILIHFIPFVISGVVFLVLNTRAPNKYLVASLTISVVLGSALRGYAQLLALNFISERPIYGQAFRITASATNASFSILVAWAGFSAVEFHNRRRQRLLEDRERLLLLRHQAREQINQIDAGAADEIRGSLLASIELQAKEPSEQFAGSLRGLIEDVVRPLSHYFEQQSSDWLPPEPSKRLVHIDWRSVLSNAFRVENIYVTPLVVMLLATSLPNTFFNRGPLIAIVSVAHTMICYPMFALIKKVGGRLSHGRPAEYQARVFFVGLYFGGQILGLTSWLYTRYQEPHFFYALMAPIYAVVGGALIAFARAAIAESEAMEDALRVSADDLRWSVARARETYRQQRRALAHALHGQIQAAIASSILRLEMSARNGEFSQEVAEAIVESLKATIANTNLLANQNVSINVVLERIRSTWEGIASIETEGDDQLEARLFSDTVCAIALNDVLTELTYNSIKHGSASEVTIKLKIADYRTLSLLVSDNGQLLADNKRRGLGSALLDDCAISWARERVGDSTNTLVNLPLA